MYVGVSETRTTGSARFPFAGGLPAFGAVAGSSVDERDWKSAEPRM